MSTIKRMSSKATVTKIEKYLKQEEKTEEKLISGMNCDSENFSQTCKATSLIYSKNQEEQDRKYYHIIQSFSPKDRDNLTLEKAHKIGEEFAKKNFKGFEVLVVTHKDKDHIHNHFVINSVSFETGKKYRADNKSLWDMKRFDYEQCKQNGLINSMIPIDRKSKNKITTGELRKMIRGEDVWKSDLKNAISFLSEKAQSYEEFFKGMKEKFNCEFRFRDKKSKGEIKTILECKPNLGQQKNGRDIDKFFNTEKILGTDFGKENLDGIIGRNAEKARGENGEIKTGADTRGIEQAIRNRTLDITHGEIEQREREIARINKEYSNIEERKRGDTRAINQPTNGVSDKDRGIGTGENKTPITKSKRHYR